VRKKIFLVLLPAILLSENIGIEIGFYKNSFTRNFFDVNYEIKTPVKNLPIYTTYAFGGWEGELGSGFVAAGKGIEYGDKLFVKLDISICYITHTTKHLSTHYQFKDRVRVGYRFDDNYSFTVGFVHFSNGGIKKPNTGENFFIIGLIKNF